MAAIATFALKAGVWFRRGRRFMVSPDSPGTSVPAVRQKFHLSPCANEEPGECLLRNISQLIVAERAIFFEREKSAKAPRECRHSAAGTVKFDQHASLL
jgi:hypothetical protein